MANEQKLNIPAHIGLIMDGNRRWATERNLPTLEGHARGYEIMKRVGDWCFSRGVAIVSLYAFSTENWSRSRDEVNYLMKLLKHAVEDDIDYYNERECKVLISGRLEELPGDLPQACVDIMDKTKDNKRGIVNICLNYGGHIEIIEAVKKMFEKKLSPEQVHEGTLRKYLYHGELPDPDIIVRTSGEQRLSGFLLWQSSYAELFL